MKLILKRLALEITRRCDMACGHCMRGDAQKVDMDYNALEQIFINTSRIEQLIITGGEPSLVSHILDDLPLLAEKHGCEIGYFHCHINAKEYRSLFAEALNQLHQYCTDPEKCVLSVAQDQFHEEPSPKAVREYKKLPFFIRSKERLLGKADIVNRGRAKENDFEAFDLVMPQYIFGLSVKDETLTVEDRLYVNVYGDVLADADLSYTEQSKYSIGNVLDQPFYKIVSSRQYTNDEPKGFVYRMTVNASANTIVSESIKDVRHYAKLSKALYDFSSLTTNLQMTPTPDDANVYVEATICLKRDDELPPDTEARACLYYFTPEDEFLGDVNVIVERLKLEDA